MRRYTLMVLVLVMSGMARGQHPAGERKMANGIFDSGVYALFSAARPNIGDDLLLGGTFGGYVHLRRSLGVDARLSTLGWGPSPYHEYMAVAGPRIDLNRGHWTVYGSAEGGVGHAERQFAGSWLLTTGVDYSISPHVKLRLGEFGYGDIEVLRNGLNPKTFSAGIVLKPF